MSAIVEQRTLPFNEGEIALQDKFHVPRRDNPTSTSLNQYGQFMVPRAPLIGLGALDNDGRPWSTVWGGETGFSSVIDTDIVGMRALVDRVHDPVVQSLFGSAKGNDGSSVRINGQGKMVSGVTIDLENRKRVKLYGKVIMGTLENPEDEDKSGLVGKRGHAQLVVKVEESLGNCPKYLHKKHIIPAIPQPKLISTSSHLSPQAMELINKVDCFFISSYHQNTDMDTNYRGGPSGFVRIISNQPEGAVLVYPEYSGNRLYQSLGNLMMNHQAGLVFPDFETGDAVYMTVETEILINDEADAILPRSNLAVKMTVVEARYVEKALGFRGIPVDISPYTPPVRYLRTEKEQAVSNTAAVEGHTSARLVSRKMLSPSIARFRFKLSSADGKTPTYKPGQYAVFSFKDELDMGYSHMRDDDPLSLNDDYIRTFTVSSFPGTKGLPNDEFEITVRKNRNVTTHLFQWNPRTQLEVPMLGFGGSFKIGTPRTSNEVVPFIAGGIGITPLLGQLPGLDISRLRLLWSISASDLGAVKDVFQQFPDLADSTALFITQADRKNGANLRSLEDLEAAGTTIERRRINAMDLKSISANTFYLCSGHTLQTSVLEWLKGKNVVYEDFTY